MQTNLDATDKRSIDTRDANWYRAVTLAERITLLYQVETEREENSISSLAVQRFKRWRAVFGEEDALFQQRLAMDSISENDLHYYLGEAMESVRDRLSITPSWLESISRSFSSSTDTTDMSLLKKLQGNNRRYDTSHDINDRQMQNAWRSIELLFVVEPLIQAGFDRLHEGIQTLRQTRTNAPFDLDAVEELLLPNLLFRLINVVSRTIALELSVARLQGLLHGDTPDERFVSFIQRLQQPEHAIAFLKEYPVLARHTVIYIDQWVEHSLEFLQRLCDDWDEIRNTFTPEGDPGILTFLEGGAGDVHQGGQSVMILTFTSGMRIVYKPRSLAIDRHFQELLTWLNGKNDNDYPPFETLKVIDHDTYGWVEFVIAQSCASTEEVQRFYRRQGAYLALLYALQATDFHFENLIAMGEHPMLIDLESLFHPDTTQGIAQETAEKFAGDALASSVMRVMLLPQRVFPNAESEGVEMSGLGGAPGQLSPKRVLNMEWANADELHFTRKRVEMPGGHNRPLLDGQDVDVQEYREFILSGFINMYRLILRHRDRLLANDGPVACFAKDTVRVILRPTMTYAQLLQESFHPDVLRDALDSESLFDRLWFGVNTRPLLAKVISAERTDVQRGDVPMFSMRLDSHDLWTSFGERLPNFFDALELDLVRQHIRMLSEKDLKKQLWFINASLSTLSVGTKGGQWIKHSLSRATVEADPAHLLAAASTIGDRLRDLAFSGKHDTTWLGLAFIDERHWYLTPLGADLYNGLPGVILFLAYLGSITAVASYTALSRAALTTLRGQIERIRSQISSIGFSGWGGIIYTFTQLGSVWNEPELLAEAEALVDLLPPSIEKDEALDILEGSAGCIGALLSLYQCAPSKRIYDVAVMCGERLLATAQPMETGIGWITTDKASPPLTGFSHGAAGIAWALLKLFTLTGQERFREVALQSLAYERSLFSSEAKNWPDLRESITRDRRPNDQIFSTLWCHGAAGIGLSRIDALKHLDDPLTRCEIDIALETTLVDGFGTNHSLCHGDLGNIELLLQASEVLGSSRWKTEVTRLASYVLQSINEHGWICGVPQEVETPGLMVGLAGIGYGLLRLAEPTKVPSVLVLEPPKSCIKGF